MDSILVPNLFLDRESSDVKLRIDTSAGDPETVVPAHSLVLSTNSKVFKTMLDTANFTEGRTGIVELKIKGDIDDAILFLRYLYTKELECRTVDEYISLLLTAHLYGVDDLVQMSNKRILDSVTPLDVCRTYVNVRSVACEELLERCKCLMLQSAFLIFWKDFHLALDEETMIFLLGSDKLNILNEEQAMIALWRWGCVCRVFQAQTDVSTEQQITKLLPLIRTSLIGEVNNGCPWQSLWKSLPLATESQASTEMRRPYKFKKMLKFAEIFHVTKSFLVGRQYSFRKENIPLINFSVNRDILLAGFTVKVELTVDKPNQLRFLVNNKTVTVNYHTVQVKKVTRDVPYELHFVHDLIVELKTPVLLQKSDINHIIICSSRSCNYVEGIDYARPQDRNTTCSGVQFSITAVRVGIRKLYFFV